MKKKIILSIVLIAVILLPTLAYGINQTRVKEELLSNRTSSNIKIETKKENEVNTTEVVQTEEPITYTSLSDTGIWKKPSDLTPNVFYGHVLSKESYWVNKSGDSIIFTDVLVKVLETSKGNYLETQNVTITIPGGQVGDIRLDVYTNPYGQITCKTGDILKIYESNQKTRNDMTTSIIRYAGKAPTTTAQDVNISSPGGMLRSISAGLPNIYEGQGMGFQYNKSRWSSYPVNYYIQPNCPNSTISTTDLEINEIKGGVNTWENVGSSDFSWNYVGTVGTGQIQNDAWNTIFWGTPVSATAVAECFTWTDGVTGYLSAFDIVFDDDRDWSYNGTGQGVYDIKAVATHELGHTLNLKDLYGTESNDMTMYGVVSSEQRSLEWGDIRGITYLYGSDIYVPEITFNSPTNMTSFQKEIDVSVDVTCSTGVDSVECRLGYKLRNTKDNPGDVHFEPWTTLTHQTGYTYTGTVSLSSQTVDAGQYWLTVRSNSSATPPMYGYEDITVVNNGWISGWDYCKPIEIYGSSYDEQTKYQIPLRIVRSTGTDSQETDGPITRRVIYVGTNCQADFDDLRFRANDGDTSLPYWIEEISGSSAYVWVQVDYIPEAPDSTEIYMYYGNSGAGFGTDGLTTFENRFWDFEYDTPGQAVGGWTRVSTSASDTFKASTSSPKQGSQCALLHEYASDSVHGSFESSSYTGLDGYVAHFYFKEVTNARRTMMGLHNSASSTVTAVLCRDDVSDWRRTQSGSGFATLTGWSGASAGTWYRIEIFRDPNTGNVKYYKDRANGVGWVAPKSSSTADRMWVRGRYQQPTDAYFDVCYVRKFANSEPYASDTSSEVEWT